MRSIIAALISFVIYAPLVAQQALPETLINSLGMEFVLIKPGKMTVGRLQPVCPEPPDTRDVPESERWTEEDFKLCQELAQQDQRPGFTVTFDQPYYMGKFEVTQAQWETLMEKNPSHFQSEKMNGSTSNHPVENVSWEDAQRFIRRLNQLDTSATYRLPTEFEWEYAARAGASELLSWQETRKQAWIQRTDKGTTQPVGLLEPNAWGLHDMLGNVWEWVADYHNGKVYPDPTPPTTGKWHVLRGGSFTSDVVNATWFFHGGGPGNGYDVGFRVVREP